MSNIKLCFLQVTSPEIHDYSKYSTQLNKEYCKLHGYDYLEMPTVKTNEYAPQWSKIFQTIDLLKKGDYTHVFFLTEAPQSHVVRGEHGVEWMGFGHRHNSHFGR